MCRAEWIDAITLLVAVLLCVLIEDHPWWQSGVVAVAVLVLMRGPLARVFRGRR